MTRSGGGVLVEGGALATPDRRALRSLVFQTSCRPRVPELPSHHNTADASLSGVSPGGMSKMHHSVKVGRDRVNHTHEVCIV